MPLPLIITANAAVGKAWAPVATVVLGGFAVALTALVGLLDMLGVPMLASGLSAQARFAVDAGTIVTAVAAAGFLIKPIRKDLAAFLPIDPDNPVHALALVLAVLVFGTQATTFVFTDVLASNGAQPPLTLADLFLNETPLLIVALAGVGIFIRRRARGTLTRLGLIRPAWWHIALALAAAGAFIGIIQGLDWLNHVWSPDTARRIDSTTQHLFGGLDTRNPAGVVALALLPAICEELLFRGALQPRIGLVATAVLFTSIHTQYGISFDLLGIFVLALGLGLIRKYTNTTTSAACHFSYNLLIGFSFAGTMLEAAIAVELLLVAVTVYAIWANRRRAAVAENS
jgi:membrane protease YdiL (CAAX protease family)